MTIPKRQNSTFFTHKHLPFAEVRYTRSSESVFKEHLHSTFSVGAVDEGRVRYLVGSGGETLAPGELAVINPETVHSCNSLEPGGRSYYMLYLDVNWCLTVQQSLWEVEEFVPSSTIKLGDARLYDSYCHAMDKLLSPIHLQEKEQLLYEIACEVFTGCCSPTARPRQLPANIEQLRKLLRSDLTSDLPLNNLAEQLGANPYTLIRKFKAVTGITPHAYRMNCRIEQAKKLLQQGRDITDTALECGFFDQSHLHRHFKAMTTVTPQEYRVNFVQ